MASINLINGGLDVQGIVDQLVYVEREPIRRMESQTSTLQSKVSAFQSLNTKLATMLDKVEAILFGGDTVPLLIPSTFERRLESSIFAARTASSSDEDKLTATASKGSASGTYAITASNLAKAESHASTNFADYNTTATGIGTLVFTVGTEDPVTVTIDSSNNTLEGVRQAINAANAGVNATIINDGSASPYRLLITSDETGTENAFTVQDNLSGGTALSITQMQAAEDAAFTINGIAITKSTNTVSDVVSGVAFTLKDTSASAVTLTVGKDTDAVVTALQELASSYNEVNSAIRSQSVYNTTTKRAGVLSGDTTLRSIQSKIHALLTQSVSNDHTSYGIITQVGVDFNSDGSIAIDEAMLREALTDDYSGVAALMLGDGAITDGRVSYASQSSATQAGTYSIQVTTLAEQASVTGSRTVTNLTQDETLTITYGGTPTEVSLLNGDSLATVLSKINAALAANGIAATAADDGSGQIAISTNAYGSSESIAVVSSRVNASGSTGFDTTPVSDTGVDIAGTFNGNAAVGSGRTLTGAAAQPEEGLSVTIAQTTTGSYGSITLAEGHVGVEGSSPMVNLRTSLKSITDSLTGPIHYATDALNDNIKLLNDRIDEYEDRLEIRKELLTREFSRADQALRLLSVTQSSLSGQISSLSQFK